MNRENELGKKIRALRKSKGYTQGQLAKLVGIDDKHLSKIENGVHLPTYKTLKKLSQVLNFDLQDNAGYSGSDKSSDKASSVYSKILKIVNSAKSDVELNNYYNILKMASKLMDYKR